MTRIEPPKILWYPWWESSDRKGRGKAKENLGETIKKDFTLVAHLVFDRVQWCQLIYYSISFDWIILGVAGWWCLLYWRLPSEYFKWTFYPLYFAVLLLTEKPVKVETFLALALPLHFVIFSIVTIPRFWYIAITS